MSENQSEMVFIAFCIFIVFISVVCFSGEPDLIDALISNINNK